MRKNTYWTLQTFAAGLCTVSTWTAAETLRQPSLSVAMLAVGWGDWGVTALVSMSFGLVSLLQRFKSAEAGARWKLLVAAHMGGSLISGVMVYMGTQAAFDAPNRFVQALMIGAAGWGGSTMADWLATKINRQTMQKDPQP